MGLSLLLNFFAVLICISAYVLPTNKQGVNDQAYVNTMSLDAATLEARNDQVQTDTNPSVHEHNVYWESFGNSGVMPSASGITCPAGYVQHPEDVSGLKVNGGRYNHFHCYTQGVIDTFQAFLGSDFDHGWGSAAVIWCAPVAFRDPGCLGMPEGAIESGPANFSESLSTYRRCQGHLHMQNVTLAATVYAVTSFMS